MPKTTTAAANPPGNRSAPDLNRRPVRLGNFTYPTFEYRRPADADSKSPAIHQVAVVGGGMVGLTIAIDLAAKGIRTVLLDDNDTVSAGSRSIAQARRTMEIWSRLGCAEPMRAKGISWSRGRTHHGHDTVVSFTIFAEGESRFPSITSLAQYYVEHFLVERALQLPNLDLRWLNRVVDVKPAADRVALDIRTPDAEYRIEAHWVVAADGAKSTVRSSLGLPFSGDRLQDKFVIADVRVGLDLPFERNYWFDPPFYDGNTVLRVPESDSIWRIDWQVDPAVDEQSELSPANVNQRLTRILGGRTDFEAEWVSTYTSEHRLMENFRHDRVFFVGDAAHQFSPFGGGRGGNSGIQDADNLAWKLAAVIDGRAGEKLLDSYSDERRPIALRNLADSSKSTEFITPKSAHSVALHDAILNLAKVVPFAQKYVNTGRFAVWPVLVSSPLSILDRDPFTAEARTGTPVLDCALICPAGRRRWLTEFVGEGFTVVVYGAGVACDGIAERLSRIFPARCLEIVPQHVAPSSGEVADVEGAFARIYDAAPSAIYLFRPDQHVMGRWRVLDAGAIERAMLTALCRVEGAFSR